jgi:hypothetical protein
MDTGDKWHLVIIVNAVMLKKWKWLSMQCNVIMLGLSFAFTCAHLQIKALDPFVLPTAIPLPTQG